MRSPASSYIFVKRLSIILPRHCIQTLWYILLLCQNCTSFSTALCSTSKRIYVHSSTDKHNSVHDSQTDPTISVITACTHYLTLSIHCIQPLWYICLMCPNCTSFSTFCTLVQFYWTLWYILLPYPNCTSFSIFQTQHTAAVHFPPNIVSN